MAIREIVTRGFGNGTYSPGVNKIPTRGYNIVEAVDVPEAIYITAVTLSLPTINSVTLSLPSITGVTLEPSDGD